MPSTSTGPKIFWTGPRFLCWTTKNFGPHQKFNCINSATPNVPTQCVNQFLVWHKKLGPAQNILEIGTCRRMRHKEIQKTKSVNFIEKSNLGLKSVKCFLRNKFSVGKARGFKTLRFVFLPL